MSTNTVLFILGLLAVIAGLAGIVRAFERRALHLEMAAIGVLLVGLMLAIRFTPWSGPMHF